MTHTIVQYEDGRGTTVGDHTLPDEPTVRSIVDAVSQINCGQNADEFLTGRNPYDGDLVRVVDGWLVVTSNGEGQLSLIHAQES